MKSKQILNSKELSEFLKDTSKIYYSIKGKVEGVLYDDGRPVEGRVNIAWICKETKERFDLIWGYDEL